jgi:uncharacterized protein
MGNVMVREDEELGPVEVATSFRERSRGLLGRDGIEGALLLRPASSIHTFRMRFDLDVAYLDRDLRVLRVTTMPRNRLGPLVPRTRAVLEAEAGTFATWRLQPGDQLQVETR